MALAAVACTPTPGDAGDAGDTTAPPGAERWIPDPGVSWQWQLTDMIDASVDADVFNIDLFDAPESTVQELRTRGVRVICYLSAGSLEDWRVDAGEFPDEVVGRSNGWEGERWLDIRRIDVLGPIMEARLDLCAEKGFDAVEPDNVDGYANETGFPLTAADQLAYNRFLARAAHERGLSIGLKNDLDQVGDLVDDFDFAVNEECFTWDECELLVPFIEAGKAVFHVEYEMDPDEFCPAAAALGFSSMRKDHDLDAWRLTCP